jgi:hypothetical protein
MYISPLVTSVFFKWCIRQVQTAFENEGLSSGVSVRHSKSTTGIANEPFSMSISKKNRERNVFASQPLN